MTTGRTFDRLATAIAACATLAAGGALFPVLPSAGTGTLQATAPLAAAASGLLALFLGLQRLLAALLSRSGVMRALVLGRDRLDGTWVQVAQRPAPPELWLIEIAPGPDGLRITATLFDDALEAAGLVEILPGPAHWPLLPFRFEIRPGGVIGSGEWLVERRGGRPVRWSGVVGASDGRCAVVTGLRLADRRERRALGDADRRLAMLERLRALLRPDLHPAGVTPLGPAARQDQGGTAR